MEQALKDAAREKLVLNGESYRGGWDELHRLRADLLELTTDLVAKDECCTALSAAALADLVLTQASRTRNGADAYFTAKVMEGAWSCAYAGARFRSREQNSNSSAFAAPLFFPFFSFNHLGRAGGARAADLRAGRRGLGAQADGPRYVPH